MGWQIENKSCQNMHCNCKHCALLKEHVLVQAKEGSSSSSIGVSAEELSQLQEQAQLDFHRIAVLMEQNQELQVH